MRPVEVGIAPERDVCRFDRVVNPWFFTQIKALASTFNFLISLFLTFGGRGHPPICATTWRAEWKESGDKKGRYMSAPSHTLRYRRRLELCSAGQ